MRTSYGGKYGHRSASFATRRRGLQEGPPSTSVPSLWDTARRTVPSQTQVNKLALCGQGPNEQVHRCLHFFENRGSRNDKIVLFELWLILGSWQGTWTRVYQHIFIQQSAVLNVCMQHCADGLQGVVLFLRERTIVATIP